MTKLALWRGVVAGIKIAWRDCGELLSWLLLGAMTILIALTTLGLHDKDTSWLAAGCFSVCLSIIIMLVLYVVGKVDEIYDAKPLHIATLVWATYVAMSIVLVMTMGYRLIT